MRTGAYDSCFGKPTALYFELSLSSKFISERRHWYENVMSPIAGLIFALVMTPGLSRLSPIRNIFIKPRCAAKLQQLKQNRRLICDE